MTLSQDFSPWEHLQTTLIRTQNRIVRDEFKDVGDETWTPDISLPRGSLRVACTLLDNDTATMTLIRLLTYYFVLRKARDLQPPVYGSTIWNEGTVRKHRPQIMLYFQQDLGDIEPGYAPVTGEISIRLMDETSTSLTETKLNTYATKIKTEFATGSGYVWKKGRSMASYTDWNKGYQLQLLCRLKSDAKELIGKVLDLQSHTPDWKNMNFSENDSETDAFPIIPGNQTILGKTRKKQRRRPIESVRFQYAVLKVDGLPNVIPLVDCSGIFRDAIEVVY